MKVNRLIRRIFFIAGVCLLLYPFVSRAVGVITTRVQVARLADDKVLQQRRAKALKKYEGDAFIPDLRAESLKGNVRDRLIGSISLPSIGEQMLLFDAITEQTLRYGAGVIRGSSPPIGGKSTHSVISAHSGLPGRDYFSNMKKMKKGDVFLVTVAGKTRAYEVDAIRVVEPTNVKHVQIVPGKDLVTLVTCTPVPANTHRLLVRGHRVPYTPEIVRAAALAHRKSLLRAVLFLTILIVLLILLLWWLLYKRRKKKEEEAVLDQVPPVE